MQVLRPSTSVYHLLKITRPRLPRCNSNFVHTSCGVSSTLTDQSSADHGLKWDLMGAVCLERKPVITPQPSQIEREISDLMKRLEFVQSLKSDHELRQEEEIKRAKQLKESDLEETDAELASKQTSQDFEDACNEEFAKFQPASRITDADQSGDRTTHNRFLDRHLLLVVKTNENGKSNWILPQIDWKKGETLRQTAERALSTFMSDVDARFLGNAPWGVHTIKYPQSVRQKRGTSGLKIFFFKAQLVNGKCIPVNREHSWIGRRELDQFLETQYLNSVKAFLIDED